MKAVISKEKNLSSVRTKKWKKINKSFHIKRETEFRKQSLGAALHLTLSPPPYLGVLPLTKANKPDLQLHKKRMRH